MTAVIQPDAPKFSQNYGALPGSRVELQKIAARVPAKWLTALGDTTSATVATALLHLRKSFIVHFASHGNQDIKHPLDSALILSDGPLKVSDIMRKSEDDTNATEEIRKSMSLAFLSACETAKGDESTPDEAIHLAATLMFAGFHGVVATMW
jgi:CHAT domain-containing protein